MRTEHAEIVPAFECVTSIPRIHLYSNTRHLLVELLRQYSFNQSSLIKLNSLGELPLVCTLQKRDLLDLKLSDK